MISKIFNIILESNTFNFLIFVGLVWLICKKINLGAMLSELQKQTETEVNHSTKIKKDSQNMLVKAENMMKNVENDVDEIIKKSEMTAKTIGENIVSSAKGQIDIIESNALKARKNDIYKTKRILGEFTVKKSIEMTRAGIEKRLEENKFLHQKYIDEALNELEGISF